MNATLMSLKRGGGACLALASLLMFAAGCGAQLPTAPAVASPESITGDRSAQSGMMIQDNEPNPSGDPVVTQQEENVIVVGGNQPPPNHGRKKPKKPH